MGNNGEAMGPGFQVNEAKTFDAVFVRHARHGEDAGLGVNGSKLVVGNIAKEFYREVRARGGGGEQVIVVLLAMGADEPVLERGPLGVGQGLERIDDFKLAFAGV